MITLDTPTKSLQAALANDPVMQNPTFVAQYVKMGPENKMIGMSSEEGVLDGRNAVDLVCGPDFTDVTHDIGFLKILNIDNEGVVIHLSIRDNHTSKNIVFATVTLRPLDCLQYDQGELFTTDSSGRRRVIQENVDIEKGQHVSAVYLNDLLDVDTEGAVDGSVLVHDGGVWHAAEAPQGGVSEARIETAPRSSRRPSQTSSYLCLKLNHEQHPVVNEHIIFNDVVGKGGSEITCHDGIFTLQAGIKWRLYTMVCANFFTSEGELVAGWFDVTNPADPQPLAKSIRANIRAPGAAKPNPHNPPKLVSCQPEAFAEFVAKRSIQVECRFISVANVDKVDIHSTYAMVEMLSEL